MSEVASETFSRYVVHAFEKNMGTIRLPRQKLKDPRVVTTARVVLSVQYDGEFSFISRDPVDIRGDSADWYGYPDGIPCEVAPSMTDVIAQAHELIYGNAFNKATCRDYLDIDECGIIQRILGIPGRYTCFVVNGQYAYDSESEYANWGFRGLGYRETPISDLDVIEVFGFQQSVGLDYYTYFLNPDGSWLRMAVIAPGEPITLHQEGYLFAIGGPFRQVDRIEQRLVAPITQSRLAIVDPITFELFDIEGAVTDEKGVATFSLSEPGDYYVTAYDGLPPRNRASLSLPLLPVIVR